MKPGRGFSNWIDRLVATSYAADQEILYKARILASIVWVYIALILVSCFLLLLLVPLSVAGKISTAVLMLGMAAGYGYILRKLKAGDNYNSCIDAVIFLTYAGVASGIAVSGGPIAAPCTPILIVPIVMAFSLGTRNSGIKWCAIVFFTHFALLYVHEKIMKFPQFLNTDEMLAYHIEHWIITYFAIMILMLIFSSITYRMKRERDAERDRYAYLAAHDPLTGLANRSLFDAQLSRALASGDRNKTVVGLMMIDLDGFKPVNDRYGHDAGDQVLRIIAERLQNLLRKTDTVARMGGDEFAVILENVMTPPGVGIVAERVIAEINRPYEGLAADVRIGASVGVAVYPDHTSNEENLRIFADRAMYAAKKKQNCVQFYSPEMEALVSE